MSETAAREHPVTSLSSAQAAAAAPSHPLLLAHKAQGHVDRMVADLRARLGGADELSTVARQVAEAVASPSEWHKLPGILDKVLEPLPSSSLALAGLSLTLLTFFLATVRASFYAVYMAARIAGAGVQAALLAVLLVYVHQTFVQKRHEPTAPTRARTTRHATRAGVEDTADDGKAAQS